jgi:predicted small lipoprotein YifL
MKLLRTLFLLIPLATAAALLQACGQVGPLYQPPQDTPAEAPGTTGSAVE